MDFPVFHYKLQLNSAKHWTAFANDSGAADGSLCAGCRVYLKFPDDTALQRPCTPPCFFVYVVCNPHVAAFQLHLHSC